MFINVILKLIKKPMITVLLILQTVLVLGQFYQNVARYDSIVNKESVLSTLTNNEDTIITIEAMTAKDEIETGKKRDDAEIEGILKKYSLPYNKYFIGGVSLSEEDAGQIIPSSENYQYLLDTLQTDVILVREPIKGDLVLSEGENFNESDFDEDADSYPVLLGEAYKGVHQVGDIFTVDMTTGGGLGKLNVRVKGFVKSRRIQPILTTFFLESTNEVSNHFIIAIPPTIENPMFQATSYAVQTNEQELQQLQHDIYQLENNKYYIEDIFSSLKKEAINLKEEKKALQLYISVTFFVVLLTFYLIAKQQFLSNKFEYAVNQLLGTSPLFNVAIVFLQYFFITSIGVIFWGGRQWIFGGKEQLVQYSIQAVCIVYVTIFLAILPTLVSAYFQPIAEDIKKGE